MKRVRFSFLLLAALACFACDRKEKDPDVYFIKFKLKNGERNDVVSVKQESPSEITGNDIRDSDFISVGFTLSATFKSPSKNDITQMLTFHFFQLLPKEEFSLNAGVYEFRDPSGFDDNIPSGNLFENDKVSFQASFYEDNMTFCSAFSDETFDEFFKISETRYYVDSQGNDAVDLKGTFSARFNSMCNNGDNELTEGEFRIKVLIDEIP